MLLSPESGPQEREQLGCNHNLFGSIPKGITKTCKDFFNERIPHPWTPQDKNCDSQVIDYLKNTNVGSINMKDKVCKTISKRNICTTPFLKKMCFGKWEGAKECKDIGNEM